MQNLNTPLIVRGRLIENSAPNFTIAPVFSYLLGLPPSAASFNKYSRMVYVSWLWLSVVLHYSWMVIRLIAVH